MCPKNDTTDQINEFVMNQIPGEAKILLSADSVDSNQAAIRGARWIKIIIQIHSVNHFPQEYRSKSMSISIWNTDIKSMSNP